MSLVSGSSMSHFTDSLQVQGIFYFFHVWGEKEVGLFVFIFIAWLDISNWLS